MPPDDPETHSLVIGDTEVELRHPVRDSLRVDDVVVVVLDVPQGTVDVDNVLGFSTDGERLWEIDNPVAHSTGDVEPTGVDAYVGVRADDGAVWATMYADARHRIDVETGEILEKEQTWP